MKSLDEFRKRLIVLVVLTAFSILLMLLDSVGVLSILFNLTSALGAPIQLEFKKATTKVNDVIGVVRQISTIKQENEKLKEENNDLLEKVAKLQEFKSENQSLRDQLSLEEEGLDILSQARVVSSDLTYENSIQINAGTNEGVEVGDVVVYGKYAIGVVKKVTSNTSKVLLINSQLSNIPVRGQKNGAIGIAVGSVGLTLQINEILPDEAVEKGEIVVTSGVESDFPAGFIIGVVKEVDDNPTRATKVAYVEVQLDFSKLDRIYVIKGT